MRYTTKRAFVKSEFGRWGAYKYGRLIGLIMPFVVGDLLHTREDPSSILVLMLTTWAGWVRELLGIIFGGLAACLLQAAIFLLSEQGERHRLEIEALPEALIPASDLPQVTPGVGAPFTPI